MTNKDIIVRQVKIEDVKPNVLINVEISPGMVYNVAIQLLIKIGLIGVRLSTWTNE